MAYSKQEARKTFGRYVVLVATGLFLLLSAASARDKKDSSTQPTSEWFTAYPALEEFSFTIIEAPASPDVKDVAYVGVEFGEGVTPTIGVSGKGAGDGPVIKNDGMRGGARLFTVVFRSPGDYVVSLGCRPINEPGAIGVTVAKWEIRATCDPERVSWLLAAPEENLASALERKNAERLRSFLSSCRDSAISRKTAARTALGNALLDRDAKRSETIRSLLERTGLDPEISSTLLNLCMDKNRIDVARWILAHWPQALAPDENGATLLHSVASPVRADLQPIEDESAWASLFVANGGDINAKWFGKTALHEAAARDSTHDLLVTLVELGADLASGDDDGNTALSLAIQYDAQKNAAFLRSKNPLLHSYEFPSSNDSAACEAILSGNAKALRTVKREELTAMTARTVGMVPATPLHLAAERGSRDVVRALVSLRVNWNVPDRNGLSPLAYSILAGRTDVSLALLDGGADPNYLRDGAPKDDATPFDLAMAQDPAFALAMLKKGYTPTGKNTASVAVYSGSPSLVRSLKNVSWSKSDLSRAVSLGMPDICDHIAERMALSPDERAAAVQKANEKRIASADYAKKRDEIVSSAREGKKPPARRGTFMKTVDSWSPWTKPVKRDIKRYPVGVYVPDAYDGSEPFGLVVSMTNAKSKSPYPREFENTLDTRKLIWVGFDPYTHTMQGGENAAFCLAVVHSMIREYSIDPSRLYIGGFSLGGQLTRTALLDSAWPFTGTFIINISYQPGGDDSVEWNYARERIPAVIVSGDYDYNRGPTQYSYKRQLLSGYRNLAYLNVPLQGHRLVPPETFDAIIAHLDEKNGKSPRSPR